jgi:hypothetical protein
LRVRRFLAGVVCLVMASGVAAAVPLDGAACDAAKREQGDLTDVPAVLERGADWGKANATPQMLARVARWIELQETLSFRCGRGFVTEEAKRAAAAAELIENPPPPPPAPTPATAAPAPAAVVAAPAAAQAPADVAAPAAVKPKPKPRAKPKPKLDAADGGGEAAPTAAGEPPAATTAPKKKRPAKPDAYVPPGNTGTP